MIHDDARIDRDRLDDLGDDIDRAVGDQADGTAVVVARTFAETSYPTTANVRFACMIQDVGGTETEGSSGSLSDTGAILYPLNLGTAIPPVGTAVIVVQNGDRWSFRYDG